MGIVFSVDFTENLTASLRNDWNTLLGSSAILEYFDGTLPATCEDPDDGTSLGVNTFNSTPFAFPSGTSFSANPLGAGSVAATSTATYWRMKDGSSVVVAQGDVGTTVAESIQFNTVSWTIGEGITITALDFNVLFFGVP